MELFKKILAVTDCSEDSKQAVYYAAEIAKKFNARLTVLNVINPSELLGYFDLATIENKEKEIDTIAMEHLEKFWNSMKIKGFEPRLRQVQGDPFTEIIKYAKENEKDVIVITTHGKSNLKYLMLGSVADKIIRYSPIPVITVKLKDKNYMNL